MVDAYALTQELSHKKETVDQLTKRVSELEVDAMGVSEAQKDLHESERIRQQQYQQLLLLSSRPNPTESTTDASDKETPGELEAQLQLKRLQADQQRLAKEMVVLPEQQRGAEEAGGGRVGVRLAGDLKKAGVGGIARAV